MLAICTESRQHQKVVVHHIWKDALEVCEDIRHQSGMKELYQHCKEMIERLFRTAKKYHNLRYTREEGEFCYFKCIKIVEGLSQNIKRQTSKECLSLL